MTTFNPPPGWPAPPAGFVPDEGWQPDPHWPAAPPQWSFWVDDAGKTTSPPPGAWPGPDAPRSPLPTGTATAAPEVAPRRRRKWLVPLIAAVVVLALTAAAAAVFLASRAEPQLTVDDVERAYRSPITTSGFTADDIEADTWPDGVELAPGVDECSAATLRIFLTAKGGARATLVKPGAEDGQLRTLVFQDSKAAKAAFDRAKNDMRTCRGDTMFTARVEQSQGILARPRFVRFGTSVTWPNAGVAVAQWGNTVTIADSDGDLISGHALADDLRRQLHP